MAGVSDVGIVFIGEGKTECVFWNVLRGELDAVGARVTDLAASADIEDIMLCDIAGVCAYLGLPDDSVPSGRNGKAKMKSLFRARDPLRPYHEADKALPLIQAPDMQVIRDRARFLWRLSMRLCLVTNLWSRTKKASCKFLVSKTYISSLWKKRQLGFCCRMASDV